jgi:hypothetical protein
MVWLPRSVFETGAGDGDRTRDIELGKPAVEQIFSTDEHEFQRISEGRYQFVVPEMNTDFDVNQVRRERHQLHAEVTVYCDLAGVKTHNRELFMAGLNLSSLRDRDQVARSLATSTKIGADTWAPVVHELSTRIRQAEDVGAGVVNLQDVPRPAAEQFFRIGRLLIPRAHHRCFLATATRSRPTPGCICSVNYVSRAFVSGLPIGSSPHRTIENAANESTATPLT